tara:strand:+ start:952 stop:2151 length:1200 start_codon:yes stop_codon:yes gene_type:complete
MDKVLLTYGWVRSSYAALRNLNQHNIPVVVSDSTSFGMSQFSRYKKGFVKYKSHYEDEEKFINNIIKICDEEHIDLIFPSHNETEVIARNKDKFNKGLVALIPDSEHCKIFNNKSLSYDLAEELGIPIPKRIKYTNPNTLAKKISDQNINNTVIKLLTGNSSKGVFYAKNPKQAQHIVKELIYKYDLEAKRFPQVEEQIYGEGYGSSVLYWHGEQIASFTHRRLREKIETGGTSTYREVARHEGIENAAKKIFNKVGWHGLAMSEFKVCKETGNYWFIEINPRMWGSIPLAIQSGVEFPYLAWLCNKEGPIAAKNYYKKSNILYPFKAKWLLGEIFVFIKAILRLDFKSAANIFKNEKVNAVDDFFWDDPFSFVGEVLAYFKSAIMKRSTNASEDGMLK